MMQRTIKLLLLVGFLSLGGFFLLQKCHLDQLHHAINERQEALTKQGQRLVQEEQIGQFVVSRFLPNEQGIRDGKLLQNLASSVINEHVKTSEVSEKHAFFVYFKKEEADWQKLQQYAVCTEEFTMNGKQLTNCKQQCVKRILVEPSGNIHNLRNVFVNTELAEQVLSRHFDRQLGKQGLSSEQLATYKNRFAKIDVDLCPYVYKDGHIRIDLPEGEVGLSQLDLPVKDLFGVVKEDYLSRANREEFDQHRQAAKLAEEKVKQRARQKLVALTFDDGPNSFSTPRILDSLKKNQVPATFFMMGQNVAANEEVARRICEEGHELANHSWNHPNLTTISPAEAKEQLDKTQDAIKKATGQTPGLFRPPYGSVNQAVMDKVGLPAVYWTVDTEDWKSRDAAAILSVVKQTVKPGSIILMHDIYASTADALPKVIHYLKAQGYTFVTVSDLVGKPLQAGYIYYSQSSASKVK